MPPSQLCGLSVALAVMVCYRSYEKLSHRRRIAPYRTLSATIGALSEHYRTIGHYRSDLDRFIDSGRTCPRQASLSETIGAIGDGTIGAIGEVLSDYRTLSEYYRSSLSESLSEYGNSLSEPAMGRRRARHSHPKFRLQQQHLI